MASQWPLRILVAEDNLVNQQLVIQWLQRLGYRSDVVSNGLEVIDAVERQDYDVILMDVHMPEMDGLTATQTICARWSPEQRPWIIAMTANAMAGDRKTCMDAGMDDYISKPIHTDALVSALQNAKPRQTSSDPTATASDPTIAASSDPSAPVDSSAPAPPTDSTLPADPQEPTNLNAASSQPDKADSHTTSHTAIDHAILSNTLASVLEAPNEDSHAFITMLCEAYFKDSPSLIDTMTQGLEQNDPDMVKYAAHTLKSSSKALGGMNLGTLCQTLETSARDRNLSSGVQLLEQIKQEYQCVADELSEYMKA